jgi:hypothetical protein
MSSSPNLALPYIFAAQAQKHVTHNEAIRMLDAIVHLAVLARDISEPPPTPQDGDRYLVADDATDAWAGESGNIAAFQDGAWAFFTPRPGWMAWIVADAELVLWDGTGWVAVTAGSATSVAMLGINATADTTNRLASASAGTLLSHDGAGHQIKVNKAASGDTASLLFQTGWSGRAEMGTVGDDAFHIKVSPDGSTWFEGLVMQDDGSVLVLRLRIATPDGVMIERPADQSDNAVNFRSIVNRNAYTGTGVGGEDYANEVVAWGWNLAETVGVADDTDQAAIFDVVEYKYNVGGKYHAERHMEMLDTAGDRHRFWSFAVPHDGGSDSSHQMAVDEAIWRPFDESRVVFQWQLTNGYAYVGSASYPFRFRFEANDAAILQQRNGAGTSWLTLPYFDSSDRLVITGRQQINPGAIPGGEAGVKYTWNNGEVPNGTVMFDISGNTQTNSEFYAFWATASTNWRIKTGIRNTHASGVAQAEVIASGPAYFRAHDFTNNWSFGKNASGNFFLGRDDPGTYTVLTVDKTRLALELEKPPKLPSYTVAALPSAATYGAGSMIYVSDETGGAVVAFSDGTDWRRMTDRAVVS